VRPSSWRYHKDAHGELVSVVWHDATNELIDLMEFALIQKLPVDVPGIVSFVPVNMQITQGSVQSGFGSRHVRDVTVDGRLT
jgi:hypothetical protein